MRVSRSESECSVCVATYSELVESITDMAQVRKKTNRFEGLTEDEVMLKTLPDHLTFGLDIVIVRELLI